MSPNWSKHRSANRTPEVTRGGLRGINSSIGFQSDSNQLESVLAHLSELQDTVELRSPVRTSTPILERTAHEDRTKLDRRIEELGTLNNLMHQIWHLFYPYKHPSCPWNHSVKAMECDYPDAPLIDTNVAASYSIAWNQFRSWDRGWCQCADCQAQTVGETLELKDKMDLNTASTSTLLVELEKVEELSLPVFVVTDVTVSYAKPSTLFNATVCKTTKQFQTSKQCGLPGILNSNCFLNTLTNMASNKEVWILKNLSDISRVSTNIKDGTEFHKNARQNQQRILGFLDSGECLLLTQTRPSASLLQFDSLPPPPESPLDLNYTGRSKSVVKSIKTNKGSQLSTGDKNSMEFFEEADVTVAGITGVVTVNEVRSSSDADAKHNPNPSNNIPSSKIERSLSMRSSNASQVTTYTNKLPPQYPNRTRSGKFNARVSPLRSEVGSFSSKVHFYPSLPSELIYQEKSFLSQSFSSSTKGSVEILKQKTVNLKTSDSTDGSEGTCGSFLVPDQQMTPTRGTCSSPTDHSQLNNVPLKHESTPSLPHTEIDSENSQSLKQILSHQDELDLCITSSISNLLRPPESVQPNSTEPSVNSSVRTDANVTSSTDNILLHSEGKMLSVESQYSKDSVPKLISTKFDGFSTINTSSVNDIEPITILASNKEEAHNELRSKEVTKYESTTLTSTTPGNVEGEFKPVIVDVSMCETGERETAEAKSLNERSKPGMNRNSVVALVLLDAENSKPEESFFLVPWKDPEITRESHKETVKEINLITKQITPTNSTALEAAVQTISKSTTKPVAIQNKRVGFKSTSPSPRLTKVRQPKENDSTANTKQFSESTSHTSAQKKSKAKSSRSKTPLILNILPCGALNHHETETCESVRNTACCSHIPSDVQPSLGNADPHPSNGHTIDPNCPIHATKPNNSFGLKAFREALNRRSNLGVCSRTAYQTIYPADRLRASRIRLVMTPEQYQQMVTCHKLETCNRQTQANSHEWPIPARPETESHNVSPRDSHGFKKATFEPQEMSATSRTGKSVVRRRSSHSVNGTKRISHSISRPCLPRTVRRKSSTDSISETAIVPESSSCYPPMFDAPFTAKHEKQQPMTPSQAFNRKTAATAPEEHPTEPMKLSGLSLRESILRTLSLSRPEIALA